MGPGNLFATGLVAGGALAGVVVALLLVNDTAKAFIARFSMHDYLTAFLGPAGYQWLGVGAFAFLAVVLFAFSRGKSAVAE